METVMVSFNFLGATRYREAQVLYEKDGQPVYLVEMEGVGTIHLHAEDIMEIEPADALKTV